VIIELAKERSNYLDFQTFRQCNFLREGRCHRNLQHTSTDACPSCLRTQQTWQYSAESALHPAHSSSSYTPPCFPCNPFCSTRATCRPAPWGHITWWCTLSQQSLHYGPEGSAWSSIQDAAPRHYTKCTFSIFTFLLALCSHLIGDSDNLLVGISAWLEGEGPHLVQQSWHTAHHCWCVETGPITCVPSMQPCCIGWTHRAYTGGHETICMRLCICVRYIWWGSQLLRDSSSLYMGPYDLMPLGCSPWIGWVNCCDGSQSLFGLAVCFWSKPFGQLSDMCSIVTCDG